jgi:hypothetical protein
MDMNAQSPLLATNGFHSIDDANRTPSPLVRYPRLTGQSVPILRRCRRDLVRAHQLHFAQTALAQTGPISIIGKGM